jgi:hypothetical protein
MAERDFQTFVARLCVDAETRDRFLSEGLDAGPELTTLERSRLHALRQSGAAGLTLLAGILSGKRQSRVRSLLPHFASHVADSDWRRLWEQYARVESAVPPASPQQDAIAFARFAAATLENDRIGAAVLEYDAAFNHVAAADTLNPYPPQPARLEDADGLAPLAASPRVVRTFALDVLSLMRNKDHAQRAAAPCTLMFFRPFGVDSVRVSRVGEMTVLLLDRADGTRTLQAVLKDMRLQPVPAADPREARIRYLLQSLWAAGALCFVAPPAGSSEQH